MQPAFELEPAESFNPRTGKRNVRVRRRARRQRNAHRRVRARLARGRVRRSRKPAQACTPVTPYGRDNVTGWFIYRCGKGTLLVPAPRCLGPECHGSDGRGMRALGFAGDLGAGPDGSFSSARSAAGLRRLTGAEVAGATAELGALRDAGAIGADYWRRAVGAIERRPEAFTPIIAPGVTAPVLGQPIAPQALAGVYSLLPPSDVGPSLREGCRCTPREPDGQDPVSGWLIYRVNGGVLLTPTKKCIAGGGGPLSWLAMTWRNTLALFGYPPAPTQPPRELPPAPVAAIELTGTPAPAAPAPCVPDQIVGRDNVSGWFIVLRDGNRILVANPKVCP